jgi:putative ABC transport system permease protein
VLADLRVRARAIFRRRTVEAELDAELRAHMEAQLEKAAQSGLPRAEALRRVRLEFGGLERAKDECRDARGVAFVEDGLHDVRYAGRLLRKDPAFGCIAVLTLALGIGASATVFSVVNAILLKPLPYPHAERLVFPWGRAPQGIVLGFDELPWSRIAFLSFSRQSKTFEHVAAFRGDGFNLTGSGEPIRLGGVRVSAGFFPTLGVAPVLGRVFSAEEDQPGREHEVIVGHRLWQERFGGDPAVVGRAVNLNAAPYIVVGVMPAGFVFPRSTDMPGSFSFPPAADLWVPLALPAGPAVRGEPSELAVVGRLKPGVASDRAQAELDVFAQDMERQFPRGKGWFSSRITPMARQVAGDTRRPLLLMLGAVGIVLLIACGNVANLLLTRSMARARELGLRSALGAGGGRLVRQLTTESLLLSLVAGVAGVMLAAAGIRLVRALGPANIPRLSEVTLDVTVLMFALAVTTISGLACGLVPALAASREGLGQLLKEGSVRSSGGARAARVRNMLLVSEVALALVLVIASGLLVRTFVHLVHADAGFNAESVLTFELTLPASTYPDADRIVRLYHGALDRLRAVPGVQAAGIGETVPMGGAGESTGLRIPGRPISSDEERPFANYTIVSPGYLSAVGTPLVRGRDFLDTDTADSPPVAIVSRAMARTFWPGQDAIGKTVGLPIRSDNMTVIGIVADVKHLTLRESPGPEIYVPYTQKPWPSMATMHVAVRTRGEPASAAASFRAAIAGVDPDLPLAHVATLSQIVDDAVAQPRFSMILIGAFGVLAVVLACVGLYGTVSYAVIDRRQEIGIRIALGAQRRDILGIVLRQGMRLTAAGIAIGLVGAFVALRMMAGFLYGVEPTDAPTFAVVSALLLGVALVACYVPARRAMRVDPATAMRSD